mmetsp:Transcript_16165/g.50823  ORF Transcript_16165/g.50823 Transcript_16165/m.50823 type:complete len:307 (+) Transcript_16165:685-1605(+)
MKALLVNVLWQFCGELPDQHPLRCQPPLPCQPGPVGHHLAPQREVLLRAEGVHRRIHEHARRQEGVEILHGGLLLRHQLHARVGPFGAPLVGGQEGDLHPHSFVHELVLILLLLVGSLWRVLQHPAVWRRVVARGHVEAVARLGGAVDGLHDRALKVDQTWPTGGEWGDSEVRAAVRQKRPAFCGLLHTRRRRTPRFARFLRRSLVPVHLGEGAVVEEGLHLDLQDLAGGVAPRVHPRGQQRKLLVLMLAPILRILAVLKQPLGDEYVQPPENHRGGGPLGLFALFHGHVVALSHVGKECNESKCN